MSLTVEISSTPDYVSKTDNTSEPETSSATDDSLTTDDSSTVDPFDKVIDENTGRYYWNSKVHNAFEVLPLDVVRHIDRGTTGDVFLMHTKSNDKIQEHLFMAAKVFKFAEEAPNTMWFFKEVVIMQSLQHDNIVKCFAPVLSPACGIILMDFIPDGSLVSHISTLTEQDVHRFFVQIACALRHIHSKRIIHGDMKPENVMIRKNSAIIIDFGLSVILPCTGCSMIKGIAGTPAYMAPELRVATQDTEYDAIKSDSFSLGVTLWCMMLRQLPDINTRFTPFIFPRRMDSDLTFGMRRLLRTDPNTRFDVGTLLAELVKRGYQAKEIESL